MLVRMPRRTKKSSPSIPALVMSSVADPPTRRAGTRITSRSGESRPRSWGAPTRCGAPQPRATAGAATPRSSTPSSRRRWPLAVSSTAHPRSTPRTRVPDAPSTHAEVGVSTAMLMSRRSSALPIRDGPSSSARRPRARCLTGAGSAAARAGRRTGRRAGGAERGSGNAEPAHASGLGPDVQGGEHLHRSEDEHDPSGPSRRRTSPRTPASPVRCSSSTFRSALRYSLQCLLLTRRHRVGDSDTRLSGRHAPGIAPLA